MEDVVKVAREISGKERIPLYLSEDEIRRLDREEAVEEGYASGKKDGIEQNRREMIINMYNKKISLETIAEIASISVLEVEKVIKKAN